MAKNIDKMLLRLLLFQQYTRGTAVGCKIVTNVKMVKEKMLSFSLFLSLSHTHKTIPEKKTRTKHTLTWVLCSVSIE